MARTLVLIILIGVLVATVFIYHFSSQYPNYLPIKEQLGKTSLQWISYTPPSEKFRVLFPLMPQNAKQTVGKRVYDMYVSEKGDGTLFMVSLINFENEKEKPSTDLLLASVANDMMESNPENKIKKMEPGTFLKDPSLTFILENTKVDIEAKTFFVKNTLYILSRISPKNKLDENEFNQFVDSFTLLKE